MLKWFKSFFKEKEKCRNKKCGWKGPLSKCGLEEYEWNGGPLAHASGIKYYCPKCFTFIREGNTVRS